LTAKCAFTISDVEEETDVTRQTLKLIELACSIALIAGAVLLTDPLGDQLRLWFPSIF
jgi:hypothetical protein